MNHKHLILLLALTAEGCADNHDQHHTQIVIDTASTHIPIRENSVLTDSLILERLKSNADYRDVTFDSFKTQQVVSGNVQGFYHARRNWDTSFQSFEKGDSQSHQVFFSVEFVGKASADQNGNTSVLTMDTLFSNYSSGCGIHDEDFSYFEESDAGPTPGGDPLNYISYSCDSLSLYSFPFIDPVLSYSGNAVTFRVDVLASAEDDYAYLFAHVCTPDHRYGWVEVYLAVITHEYDKKSGAYASFHYNVNLVNEKLKNKKKHRHS